MFLIIFGSALGNYLFFHFPYKSGTYILEEESPVVINGCRP